MPQAKEAFKFIEATNEDIMFESNTMSNKTSCGRDGLSNKTLKVILPSIVDNLTICINKSVEEQIFPERMKVSKISPFFKAGVEWDPGNWRPVCSPA